MTIRGAGCDRCAAAQCAFPAGEPSPARGGAGRARKGICRRSGRAGGDGGRALGGKADAPHAGGGDIPSLQSSLSKAESESSQSQYDLNAQKSELERLQQENDALTEQLSQMEEDAKTAGRKGRADREAGFASEGKREAEGKSKIRSRKVQIPLTPTSFSSRRIKQRLSPLRLFRVRKEELLAYSRKLAESLGYKPCPNCFG